MAIVPAVHRAEPTATQQAADLVAANGGRHHWIGCRTRRPPANTGENAFAELIQLEARLAGQGQLVRIGGPGHLDHFRACRVTVSIGHWHSPNGSFTCGSWRSERSGLNQFIEFPPQAL